MHHLGLRYLLLRPYLSIARLYWEPQAEDMAREDSHIAQQLESLHAEVTRIADCLSLLVSEEIDAGQRLSRREAARLLGCSLKTVDRRIRSGDLEIVRHGRSIRVLGSSLRVSDKNSPSSNVLRI